MKAALSWFLAVSFLLPCFCHAELATVPLATGEWEPYTSSSMEGSGAFTEIVSAVFVRMGMQPDYHFLPWKRAEQNTLNGEAFAVFPYIQTDERSQQFLFSAPVMSSTGRFFYLKRQFPNGIPFTQLEDLRPYQISGVLGYWYEKPFRDAHLHVEYVVSDEQSFRKLYLKRAQFVASEELVGWNIIHKLYPEHVADFATLPKAMNQNELRLMVSKKYPGSVVLLERFNMALAELRRQGIVSRILTKYGVSE